jgi:hypothetical protein
MTANGIGIVLLVLLALLWVAFLANIGTPDTSDAAGNAMSRAFAAFLAVVVWLVIAVLLIIAGIKGEMPAWTAAAAFILVPVSAWAAALTGDLLQDFRHLHIRGQWLIVMPVLVPLLLVFFALWAYLPSWRAAIPAGVAGGVVWGLVLILSVLPFLGANTRERAEIAVREAQEQTRAEFHKLTEASPLSEWVPYLDSYIVGNEALQHIRTSPTRQSEIEALIAIGRIPLKYVVQMELDPTPELCAKLQINMTGRLALMHLDVPKSKPYTEIAEEVDSAINVMNWLSSNGCDCRELGTAYLALTRSYEGDVGWNGVQLRRISEGEK